MHSVLLFSYQMNDYHIIPEKDIEMYFNPVLLATRDVKM